MRLFVSIGLPEDIRAELYNWVPHRPDLRQTKQELLHLTLLFLGECDKNEVILIINKLSTIQFDPFDLVIQGMDAFPNRENPRVIWAAVGKSTELINMQRQISEKISIFADDSENRSFKPHITLARTTKRVKLKKTDQLFEVGKSITLSVKSFSLKRSVLSSKGSTHTTLGKFNAE